MIEEQFLSFDTARMLKEVGFDAQCHVQYSDGGVQYSDGGVQWDASYPYNFNADDWGYSCPTQALAARWLREVHGIHVFPVYQYLSEKWSYVIQDMAYVNSEKGMKLHTDVFDSCEESLESGLREAIKLIKK